MLAPETIAALKTCSAATLTTQLFKRGLRNVFMQGVRPLTNVKTPMIGEAFTLRYIPAREDIDHVGVFADPEHPQRKAIETVPPGQVLVSDCRRDARAASGGSILLTRLKVRGAAGFVSDGGLRDSPEIAGFDLPVYCGGPAAPSRGWHRRGSTRSQCACPIIRLHRSCSSSRVVRSQHRAPMHPAASVRRPPRMSRNPSRPGATARSWR